MIHFKDTCDQRIEKQGLVVLHSFVLEPWRGGFTLDYNHHCFPQTGFLIRATSRAHRYKDVSLRRGKACYLILALFLFLFQTFTPLGLHSTAVQSHPIPQQGVRKVKAEGQY